MTEEVKMGRPTDHTDELVDRICEELAAGRSLNRICKEEDWAPDKSTFYRWMYQARKHSRQVRAGEERAARICSRGYPRDCVCSRLRPHTTWRGLRWTLTNGLRVKLLPKRYGEKQQLEHTGVSRWPNDYQMEGERR
jgi:hypothetical protein